jgi:hypothetical protein
MDTFQSHGIDWELLTTHLIITTDQGSNLIRALRPYSRLDDPCHLLNLLSKRLESPYKQDYLPHRFELDADTRATLKTIENILANDMTIIKAVK